LGEATQQENEQNKMIEKEEEKNKKRIA